MGPTSNRRERVAYCDSAGGGRSGSCAAHREPSRSACRTLSADCTEPRHTSSRLSIQPSDGSPLAPPSNGRGTAFAVLRARVVAPMKQTIRHFRPLGVLTVTAGLWPCSLNLNLRKLARCETNSERRLRRHWAFNSSASHARSKDSGLTIPLAKIQDDASLKDILPSRFSRRTRLMASTITASSRRCSLENVRAPTDPKNWLGRITFGVKSLWMPRLQGSAAARELTDSMNASVPSDLAEECEADRLCLVAMRSYRYPRGVTSGKGSERSRSSIAKESPPAFQKTALGLTR